MNCVTSQVNFKILLCFRYLFCNSSVIWRIHCFLFWLDESIGIGIWTWTVEDKMYERVRIFIFELLTSSQIQELFLGWMGWYFAFFLLKEIEIFWQSYLDCCFVACVLHKFFEKRKNVLPLIATAEYEDLIRELSEAGLIVLLKVKEKA